MIQARHPELALADARLDAPEGSTLMLLPGTPSDEVADVLATGSGDIATIFVSMATRHPDGTDADYLQWHTLDHRPEQHRLSAVRASLRLVSTPACRAARAVGARTFRPGGSRDDLLLHRPAGMDGFLTLSDGVGRCRAQTAPLPPVERGVYGVQSRAAAPRVKVGADVLPWWPTRGVYLLLESTRSTAGRAARPRRRCRNLVDVALDVGPQLASAPAGQQLTYCFLDEDPVATASRLRPVLEKRWETTGNHSALRRAVSPGRATRVGPLCAVTASGGRPTISKDRKPLVLLLDTERVDGHGQQQVAADREDQIHALLVGEYLAELVPGRLRDRGVGGELIDRLNHRLVGDVSAAPGANRADIFRGESGTRSDRQVVRPQILTIAAVHHAQ